ncbi:MAG: regulatory protein GemA [Deltaproteobacteria bacterium]
MSINIRQIALIKVATKELHLSDDEYRLVLSRLAGVESSKQLDIEGFNTVIGYLEHLGFKPHRASGPSYGNRPGMASFAQIELIRSLWAEYTDKRGTEGTLGKWLEAKFHVTSLRFLTKDAAPKVITALMVMKRRTKSGNAA